MGIIDVESAPFRTYPEVSFVVFGHATHYLAAQSGPVLFLQAILSIDFIFRIKVVHSTEIGAHPQCSLIVFDDAPDARIGQTLFLCVCREGRRSPGSWVVTRQTEVCSYPHHARIVLTKGAHEIRNEQFSLTSVGAFSLWINRPEAVVPASYPYCFGMIFIDLGDISRCNGV